MSAFWAVLNLFRCGAPALSPLQLALEQAADTNRRLGIAQGHRIDGALVTVEAIDQAVAMAAARARDLGIKLSALHLKEIRASYTEEYEQPDNVQDPGRAVAELLKRLANEKSAAACVDLYAAGLDGVVQESRKQQVDALQRRGTQQLVTMTIHDEAEGALYDSDEERGVRHVDHQDDEEDEEEDDEDEDGDVNDSTVASSAVGGAVVAEGYL